MISSADNLGSGETSTSSDNDGESYPNHGANSEANSNNSNHKKRKSRKKYKRHQNTTSLRNKEGMKIIKT